MSQFEDVYVLNRGVLMNKYQGKTDNSINQIITLQCLPAPATNALTSTAQFFFDINVSDLHMVNDIRLRLDVAETGGTNSFILCPSPYMIQKLEWQDKSGNVFHRTYNDAMFFEACSAVDLPKQNQAYLQSLNVSDKYYEGPVHPTGSTKSYRIPLVSHPFSIVESFVGNLQRLRLVIYWGGSVISGPGPNQFTGVLSLQNVYLEMNHRKLPADKLAIQRNYFKTKKITRVCSPDWISLSGQTLTASTTSNFDLSPFKGKYPFFIFAVRTSNNLATDNAYLKTLALGPRGSVDVLTPTGMSVLSNGTAPRIHLIQEEQTDSFANRAFTDNRRWFLVSFCNNAKQALAGMENGYLRLDGSKYTLAITPDVAKQDTIQTITLSAPQTQGNFILSFKGQNTNPLPFNATTAQIQTALNNLPEFKSYPGGPLTATVSQQFTAVGAGSPTITLNARGGHPPNQDSDLISFNNINCGTGAAASNIEGASTSVSTVGIAGWTTASNYVVDIYGYKQRWMTECEGNIQVIDDL